MIESITKGILLGFGLSFMTGTTFVALFNIALHKGFKLASSFAFGVFFSDVLVFLIVYLGFSRFYQNPLITNILAHIGGLLLVVYGLNLWFSPGIKQQVEPMAQFVWEYFFKGFLLNLFNPLVFVFWVGIYSLVCQLSNPLTAILVALSTMLLSDFLKAYFIAKLSRSIKSQLINSLNAIAAIFLTLIGLRLLFF